MADHSLPEEVVGQVVEQRLGTSLDAEVCTYVAGLLDDGIELEELREVLAGFSPAFEAQQVPAQDSILLELIAKVKDAQERAAGAAAAAPSAAASCARQLSALSLNAHSQTAPNEQQQEEEEEEEDTQEAAAPSEEAIALLRGLCGGCVPDAFLAHLLAAQCGLDLEAAAGRILDSSDIAAEARAWEEAEARRERERQEAEEAKKVNRQRILDKFQLEALPEGRLAAKPKQVTVWTAKDENKTKARFQDGMLVSTKGDKYIMVKTQEEWDGGSRGRVKTKGKRGPGWA